MKTADGWYQLAKGWRAQLADIPTEELTTFEAQLLEDLNKHLPDMEEDPFTKRGIKLTQIDESGGMHFDFGK